MVIYLPYVTLVTYVPVLGLSNSCFRAGYFFLMVSAQTGWNCFLLILQIVKPRTKQIICGIHNHDIWIKYVFFLWYDNVYCAEGHTEVNISVKQSWNFLSQNLDNGNIPKVFLTLKFFFEVTVLATVTLHGVHNKIFVWPKQIFLVCFQIIQHDEKDV